MVICDFCKQNKEKITRMLLPHDTYNIDDENQCGLWELRFEICYDCWKEEFKNGYLGERLRANKEWLIEKGLLEQEKE